MIAGSLALEKDLVVQVVVFTCPSGFQEPGPIRLEHRLTFWRRQSQQLGLTGALMICSSGMALIQEGPAPVIAKLHSRIRPVAPDINKAVLAESARLKRQFGSPLAYVGPSRWVHRALEGRALADMESGSRADAEFLIDLVLCFVGGRV